MLSGWGSAILFLLAHPAVAAGVRDHSGFLNEPGSRLPRLRSTIDSMLALTFGSPEEVASAAGLINGIHNRVHGELSEQANAGPAEQYSARDPELLRWVQATLLDTFMRTYESSIGPLTPAERDRYCAESARIGPLLLTSEQFMPASTRELYAYLDQMLASGEIYIDSNARRIAAALLFPPLPAVLRPAVWMMQLTTIALLPPEIRRMYGYKWDWRARLGFRATALTVRAAVHLLPPALRYWPAARRARRRAAPST